MRTVLIVDDELCKPANAEHFQREFPLDGVEYRFGGTGEEMFQILDEDENGVCAVLLDIRFEGAGNEHGLKLLEELHEKGYAIPVIMMSSLSEADTIIRAWDLGAESYILKWATNKHFGTDLRNKILKHARDFKPASRDLIEHKRNRLDLRAREVLKSLGDVTFGDIVAQARLFREGIGGAFLNRIPFSEGFQNYVQGWNETDEVIREAEANHRLLYLNMDFGDGCFLRCPHCFTMEGEIDARGRQQISFGRVKETILEAKDLGLRCVRILGRGEPTQWIANPTKSTGLQPKPGEDLIDFVQFLHENGIVPLMFTRGYILGDQRFIESSFGGAHGVQSGDDLVRLLADNGVSLFLGVSSIFPEVNDEMVGRPKKERYNYDDVCRRALRLAISQGLNRPNPTRLAVEMPITNLNIAEMAVRYVLFQCMNISPCTNVYMVTGRAMTYGLGEITDPPQGQFMERYAMVLQFARNMGINLKIGPYAGTKECHDVSRFTRALDLLGLEPAGSSEPTGDRMCL